jgi:PAS domain S-box-containing protein
MADILINYRQLDDLFDTFSMGVMVVGPDRKIISFNHSAEIITGYNESKMGGRPAARIWR